MITLPEGFDAAVLLGEFFAIAAPFVGVSFLIACGFLIINFFKSIEF